MKISRIITVLAILTAALLLFGCGGPELDKLTVQYDDSRVVIEAEFNSPVEYELTPEPGGEALILNVHGAKISAGITRERLIKGSALISGWFATEHEKGLRLKLYLTGGYPYQHSAFAHDDGEGESWMIRMNIAPDQAALDAAVKHSDAFDAAAAKAQKPSEPENEETKLAKGIRYYDEGRFDAALDMFRQALAERKRLPLAYYYAARIRFERGQRDRAEANLAEALADSADFADAAGLLAHVQSLLGKGADAAANWKRFTGTFHFQDEGERNFAATITHPDSFRAKLNAIRKERERRLALTKKARQDSIRLAAAARDSVKAAEAAAV